MRDNRRFNRGRPTKKKRDSSGSSRLGRPAKARKLTNTTTAVARLTCETTMPDSRQVFAMRWTSTPHLARKFEDRKVDEHEKLLKMMLTPNGTCCVCGQRFVGINATVQRWFSSEWCLLNHLRGSIRHNLIDDPFDWQPPFKGLAGIPLDARGFCDGTSSGQLHAHVMVCEDCGSACRSNRIPRLSLANCNWVGNVPEVMTDLTLTERMLISPGRLKMVCVKLQSWGNKEAAQSAVKGHAIVFPQNVDKMANCLPQHVSAVSDSLRVLFVGGVRPNKKVATKILGIRIRSVLRALVWLKANNPLFFNLNLKPSDLKKKLQPLMGYGWEERDWTVDCNDDEPRLPPGVWQKAKKDHNNGGTNQSGEDAESYLPDSMKVGGAGMPETSLTTSGVMRLHHSDLKKDNLLFTAIDRQLTAGSMKPRCNQGWNSSQPQPAIVDDSVECLFAAGSVHQRDINWTAPTATNGEALLVMPHDKQPISDYDPEANIWLRSFPWLFPYGIGGPVCSNRSVALSIESWAKRAMMLEDDRFQTDESFMFHIHDVIQRHSISKNVQLACRLSGPQADAISTISESDLNELKSSLKSPQTTPLTPRFMANPKLKILANKLEIVGSRCKGSDFERRACYGKIEGLMLAFGQPCLFVTLNFADFVDSCRLAFVPGFTASDLENMFPTPGRSREFAGAKLPDGSTRARQLATHPASTARYFNCVVRAWLKVAAGWKHKKPAPTKVDSNACLGNVAAYFGSVETQLRGSLHLHMLIWLQGMPDPAALMTAMKGEPILKKR
jgi:hypothetical protein